MYVCLAHVIKTRESEKAPMGRIISIASHIIHSPDDFPQRPFLVPRVVALS
jgi:hypothetical protein